MTAWEPLRFRLHGVKFSDFHGSNLLGWNLFSARTKELIDHIRLPKDNISWLPVIVRSNIDERREYFLLHHQTLIDAFDRENSRYLDEKKQIMIGAVLRTEGIGDHHVFSVPEAKHVTYVSESLKEALEAEKCTGGIVYLKVALS